MTKEDRFSYRDHNFWTKIRSCENRFSTTMDFWVFTGFTSNSFAGPTELSVSTIPPTDPSEKFFFRISIFSAEDVGDSNQHYKKVRLDPKDISNHWYMQRNDINENIPNIPNVRDSYMSWRFGMIQNPRDNVNLGLKSKFKLLK